MIGGEGLWCRVIGVTKMFLDNVSLNVYDLYGLEAHTLRQPW